MLPSVWFADIAAYMVGSRFGKHKMIHASAPKKSWEGYFGGVIFGTLLTVALAAGLQVLAGPDTAHRPSAWFVDRSGDEHPAHPRRPGREHDQAPGERKDSSTSSPVTAASSTASTPGCGQACWAYYLIIYLWL